jgi:hypothetical protein
VTATRPRDEPSAKTKYNLKLGIEDGEDATALFKLAAEALTDKFGSFTGPDDYQLSMSSGEKAAVRALQAAELAARGKSADEAFKIKERAEKRAEQFRPYKAILNASSRVAFHDKFLERYMNDLEQKERESADKFGFKLGIVSPRGMTTLDTVLLFNEYKDKFYAGAYIGGSFNLSVWDRKKADDKDGVTAYIRNLVFVKDGEKLTSERSLDDEFSHYQGMATDYSPSASASTAPAAGFNPSAF